MMRSGEGRGCRNDKSKLLGGWVGFKLVSGGVVNVQVRLTASTDAAAEWS